MTPEQERLARELSEARERWQSVAHGRHFREGAKDAAYLAWSRAHTRYLDACQSHNWDCSEDLVPDGDLPSHTCETGPEQCPWYFVLAHPEGHQHCQDCHGNDPTGPHCGHTAGCPGC